MIWKDVSKVPLLFFLTTMRQNPSLMLSLLNMMSPSSTGADANALMIWGSTQPIWSIASLGVHFFMTSFTDGRRYPANFSLDDRSRIAQYFLDL